MHECLSVSVSPDKLLLGGEDPAAERRGRSVFMAEANDCPGQTPHTGVISLRSAIIHPDPDPCVPGVPCVNLSLPPPFPVVWCQSVRTFYQDHYNVTRE